MRVPKTVLKHLATIAGAYPSIGNSDGVWLRRKGTVHTASATDGKMLIQVTWFDATGRNAPDFEAVLRSEAIKADDEGKDRFLEVTHSRKRDCVTVKISGNIDTLGGKFPGIGSVIPDYSPDECHVFTVNPKRLAKLLLSVVNALPPDFPPVVTITCPLNTNRPIRIDAKSGGLSVVAALMPIKNEVTNEDEKT